MDIDYLEAIRLYGSAMADAADKAGPELPIPTCPGWLMRDLVRPHRRGTSMGDGHCR